LRRLEALALGGAAFGSLALGARAQSTAPLRLGVMTGESFAEGFYAQDGGFFKRAGLDIEFTTFRAGGAVTAAIAGGALDIGVTNAGSMSAAYEHGLPIYLLAPCALSTAGRSAGTVLVVPKTSAIRTAKDLTGKTVAVSTIRDLQQAAVMTWIDAGGGSSKAVTFVEVPLTDQAGALAAGRIDAAMMIEPWVSHVKNDVRVIAKPYDSLGKQIMISGWITTTSWFDANRATARKFVAAMRQTALWANANPAATAPILEKYSKIPLDVILGMPRLQYGERLDAAPIQRVIDATAHYGFLSKGFSASALFAPDLS
jgi:NitT/TauT family transport system substrate-binding protein